MLHILPIFLRLLQQKVHSLEFSGQKVGFFGGVLSRGEVASETHSGRGHESDVGAKDLQGIVPRRLRPRKYLLALILIAEIWVFSGAFRKFFTHDSLFYMTNVPQSWDQFQPYPPESFRRKILSAAQSRFCGIGRPFLGLNPWPYHWIPIIFHMLNTLLFYALARRILPGSTAGLAAAAFWGLHSVAGWITYDITYLSDFLLAFLFLLALILAVEGDRRKSRWLILASVGTFVLSLMTKEAATTFPLAIWIALSLADLQASGEPVSAA